MAEKAPRFAKLAALVRRSQSDPTISGADELHFEHDRTYDDGRLREVLGAHDRSAEPMNARYLASFVSSINQT